MSRSLLSMSVALLICFALTAWTAAQAGGGDPYAGKLAKASDEWKKTVQRMQLPAGIKADLWAAEPLVANIVAFHFDEKGRCYVAETFRLHHGVSDNRRHMKWLDDDLASRTVADRVAMYKKYLTKEFADLEKTSDRVRLVEDTKGAGKADRATVFADGFQDAAAGLGAGVLARDGKVWYTCIPDLWLLQDSRGTGHADVKKSLHTGFGVHVAFIGHDMHGLRFGPDGKLYFSIGDRGLHVKDGKTTLDAPDTGSVLRCNPDGSGLEIFATGLRNPQELAFDEFGNLFTADNNADGGDAARWVHLVEGGDSGWRIGYQYLPKLGVWNTEKLWHLQATNTAAYLLPPLAHIANGPSGLTYHPGTSLLPGKYERHFFLCDFRGSGGGSGIHTFNLTPRGASFAIADREKFAWSVLATDCDFGPDGGFYLSDWVEGWGLPNKGRIYKLFDPGKLNDPVVKEVKTLLAAGFAHRSADELARLLAHKDQRIRQEAQFALADKQAIVPLAEVAKSGTGLARLHALWGLGQIGQKNRSAFEPVLALAGDSDTEVRTQALKVLGEGNVPAAKIVVAALHAAEPRVRFMAAMAAGKIGAREAIPDILDMLRTNKDEDAYLRHAGVMALCQLDDKNALRLAAADESRAVRLACLLAMRRLQMPEVARFLRDPDRNLVLEAARAIYDAPIPAALPELARMTRQPLQDIPEPAIRRILAANYRLGAKDNAQALAAAAARSDLPASLRVEALKMLMSWENPPGRDWIVGLWRPLPARPAQDVAEAVRPVLAPLMTAPDAVRSEGAKLAAKHGMKEIGPVLRLLVLDPKRPASVRIEAIKALETLKDDQLAATAKTALAGDEPRLRHQGRRILLQNTPATEAVPMLAKVIENGAMVERQGALALLAQMNAPEADRLLEYWLDQMITSKAPPEIRLDILLAVAANKRLADTAKYAAYERTRESKNPMSVHRESMHGGDAEAGRKIFFEKAEVSCLRCHKIDGLGGEVGPDLTGIGKKYKRDYLLESIVDPNKQIAKGFETLLVTLKSGVIKSGILKSEDAQQLRLMTPDGQLVTIPIMQIDERQRGPSSMPGDLVQKLSRTELRDLVEFLATLQ
jgi:quinoprotein glucose dehydrogenase